MVPSWISMCGDVTAVRRAWNKNPKPSSSGVPTAHPLRVQLFYWNWKNQRFAFVFIWFGLRRWLCELNWMISTKSQVPAAPSSKKFKHTYNSIEPKLCKVTELCCEVYSLPAYFLKSEKKKPDTSLRRKNVPTWSHIRWSQNIHVLMEVQGGVGWEISFPVPWWIFKGALSRVQLAQSHPSQS